MSHPLNELKRRLADESTPLAKRFRLAKNVAFSDHFPTTPKERVIGDWLEEITGNKKITNKDFKDVLSWLNNVDDFTVELKYKLIKIVVQYINKNVLHHEEIEHIIAFIENPKISQQLSAQMEDYLSITMTVLQHLSNSEQYVLLVDKLFCHITKYYKECRKKFEFILKILEEDKLDTIFSFLNTNNEKSALSLCQNVLFPLNKRSLFARYLNNLIRKDNHPLEEKNDNVDSVIKIMETFLTFPNRCSDKEPNFLSHFIKVFVSCFKNESQIVFAFYIIVVNCLNITQSYISTVTKLTTIKFEENDDKIKRNIFLNMLEALLEYEVDISVHLRDTLNEHAKETKKIFLLFLQEVITGTLKTEGKPDKTSLKIIQTSLKLDPGLINQKMIQLLAPIMVAKKGSSVLETYADTMMILLKTLFKLSKGIDFVHQMLPHLKSFLEKSNSKQKELIDELNLTMDYDGCCENLRSKIVNGYDIMPSNCVEIYGKLTSELMFRQNKELLLLLQKDLEELINSLDNENNSPSLVTLIEMVSAILSSFLRHNKMADHTVPLPIGEDFWTIYQNFEDQCLKKFAKCVLTSDCSSLLTSFLKLCTSFAQLKILNIKYSNTKVNIPEVLSADVFDMHSVLPVLNETQWKEIASKVYDENIILLDNLLLVKTMALNLLRKQSNTDNVDEIISNTKSHLIKQISSTNTLTHNEYFAKVLFGNLDNSQLKQLAKCLIKMYANDQNLDMFKNDSICNNKILLNTLVFEVAKYITKSFENASSLSKSLGKAGFDITTFFKDNDVKVYFNKLAIDSENFEVIMKYIEVLKHLQIYYLDENCQLTTIFLLVTLKKCCNSKKAKRSIDNVLQSIFEISPKKPDLFKIFPVDLLFDFENGILELLKLNAKTSNHVSIIKNVLETAVKKVKKEPEIIKKMVEILLNNFKTKMVNITSISDFNDDVFQLICIVLPLIAKEKKNITTSAYRSILANLQDNLNQAMLNSFKNVDFIKSNLNVSNTDNSIMSDDTMATLNAMGAYTLTLLKICETNDGTEIKSMDCLWPGLEFFVQNAIQSIESPDTKIVHVDLSTQLLNVILRYIKKLESHEIFKSKDKLFLQIWRAVKSRLFVLLDHRQKKNNGCLEEIAVTLKFLVELSTVEFFSNNIVADLNTLCILKKPSIILKNEEVTESQIISRKVLKYLCLNILKANIIDTKCTALEKLIFRSTRNIRFWIQQHYWNGAEIQDGVDTKSVVIEDSICELLKIDLDILADVILAAKKISLDYKFIDAIFELQQLVHYILGRSAIDARCEVTWQSFFILFEGCVAILNSMIVSRDELLEDRWPCLMQCYKTLVLCMCARAATINELDRVIEHKFAEIAHSIEKLTQSISKRKTHVSRIAAYAVADFCSWLEKSPPPKIIRQHLENSIVLLIQASDSNYAMAFLRRGLAGSIGQMTLTNMYTMYKRYHKYVGNA
ncbi:uncharacterized protein LOC119836076 [Zerene cesonia]|uniref:uncharacterized protein LOC119836076 n=1 Tax=Zerene cesonia TaxID=33412 RepID=UPI0018E57629|nr:uncharacterized protein LOC119836076 [Zerene cesonia]